MTETTRKSLFEISHLLMRLMWEMDQEALPVEGDYPTRLWWYPGHLDREKTGRKVQNAEVCWSRRLAKMLRANGVEAETEIGFPGSRQRCDVVADFGFPKPFWIEVKSAYRAKFDPPAPNPSYGKYLQATAEDLMKLGTLRPAHASGVALLLVGFDQAENTITEADLACVRRHTASIEWLEQYAQWHVNERVQFRERCWIWSRLL